MKKRNRSRKTNKAGRNIINGIMILKTEIIQEYRVRKTERKKYVQIRN